MIGYLEGILFDKGLDHAILLVQGVGYEVHIPATDLEEIKVGSTIALWIYTNVREDALQLFGFRRIEGKNLFLSLLKVNGVGPKSALNILSAAPFRSIIGMIESEDAKALSQLPKIGKKTAEQIILTLKGKLVFADPSVRQMDFTHKKEITSALVNLGFKLIEVENVINQMDPQVSFEDGVRKGLSTLSTHY